MPGYLPPDFIARTDREIDALVYDLYGLTEEERRLVAEREGQRAG